MIQTVWPFLGLMLVVAGFFPALERRSGWRVFDVLPPIVMVYLSITAMAIAGVWRVTPEIHAAQSLLVSNLVPALLFLLMINCDLRAIFRLGPRVLGVFACTTVSLFVAFLCTFLIYRQWLRGDDWQPLAALSGSWVGGTANMIGVKQAIGMSEPHLAMSLLTDAICYSMWVVVLFSVARLAPAFNRWTRARSSGELAVEEVAASGPTVPENVLLWLGVALLVTALARLLGGMLPSSDMVGASTWTILLSTLAGLLVAHTPLARFPGAGSMSGAMLIFVVAMLASQSNFHGLGEAPLYLLCGVTVILLHAVLLVLFARLFHFDLYLCGIASLAHIGGVAAAPVLAAAYARALVPVGILLALLGYILGTGFGLLMASLMASLALP